MIFFGGDSELETESGRFPSILPHPRARSFDSAANLRRRRIKQFAMTLAETGFLTPREPGSADGPRGISASWLAIDSDTKISSEHNESPVTPIELRQRLEGPLKMSGSFRP